MFTGAALDSTSIQLSWQPPPERLQNGAIVGYRLKFTEVGSSRDAQSADVATVSAGQRLYVLRHLSKWTAYRFWALAFTAAGDGPHSEPIIVRTDEDGR